MYCWNNVLQCASSKLNFVIVFFSNIFHHLTLFLLIFSTQSPFSSEAAFALLLCLLCLWRKKYEALLVSVAYTCLSPLTDKASFITSRPLRDPGNPGIPGFDSNPVPGICENKISGFFGIWYSNHDNVFKYSYSFSDNFLVFLRLPEPFKVLQMFTLQTLVDSTNSYQEFLWSMPGEKQNIIWRKIQEKERSYLTKDWSTDNWQVNVKHSLSSTTFTCTQKSTFTFVN